VASEYSFAPLSPGDPGQVGRYPLRARLGAGGMGRVFLSFTPGGRAVAVKTLLPEAERDHRFVERFAREVCVAQQVDGHHVAQLLDAELGTKRPWLASAFVCGPTLQQLVDETGPLPAADTLLIGYDVARALKSIHAAGVVHRDLKPANVILDETGPKVIDFGIAKPPSATSDDDARLGTVPFMAPEQLRSEGVNVRSDVFALGCTLYFLATGRIVFAAENEPNLSGIAPMLRGVLRSLLARDPADRPTPADAATACADAIGPPRPGSYLNITQALPLIRERAEALHALQATQRPSGASTGTGWRVRLRSRPLGPVARGIAETRV
jgi:serine/threonine protein kinase